MFSIKVMATLTFSFDTGSVTLSDLNDALATEFGYQATINGQPNPETKAQYNRRILGRWIRDAYRNGKRKELVAAAEASVPDVTIT